MNNRRYRLAFNALRSLPMPAHALRATTVAVWAALSHPGQLAAQIVADPHAGGNRPSVLRTANGIPQIDITRPSPAGVSTNAYRRFDVPREGAILNNASGIVTTRQAGYVNGNPNLLPGASARIIVNQVTGVMPSQMRGYLEVAGPRSEVVVANPNGIVVDGGGFINASRATLTTGAPVMGPGGSLDAFRVTGGHIDVGGAGLDGASVDQVELIARAVSANAALHADRLHVVTGANSVERATLAASPLAPGGPVPALAIDVGQLGGVYANRIVLAATELGVGVSHRGVLAAQAGDLTLTAEGRLVLAGQTHAAGHMALRGHDGIDNGGVAYATGTVAVDTDGPLRNSGTLAARHGLTANAGSIASTGVLAAGVNGDGKVESGGDLAVSARHALSATGRNVSGGNMTLRGDSISLAGSQTAAGGSVGLLANAGELDLGGAAVSAARDLRATAGAGLRNDKGTLTAGDALTLDVAGALSNRGGTLSGSALRVAAARFDNTDGRVEAAQLAATVHGDIVNRGGLLNQYGTASTAIEAGGTLDNSGGTIASNGTEVAIHAAALENARGRIQHAGHGALTLSSDGWLGNADGGMRSNGTLAATARQLSNAGGALYGKGGLALRAVEDIDNSAGDTETDGDLSVVAGGDLGNAGGMLSANGLHGTVHVSARRVANGAGKLVNAGDGATDVSVASVFDNSGGIAGGNGDTTISAARLSNTASGKVASAGTLSLKAAHEIDNRGGSLVGETGLSIVTGTDLHNRGGSAQTTGNLEIAAGGAVANAGGALAANGPHGVITVSGASIDNRDGRLVNGGDGATSIAADDGVINAGGTLGGNGDVQIAAPVLDNSKGGNVTAGRALMLAVSRSTDNRKGTLFGGTALTLSDAGAALTNQLGSVLGGQDVVLRVASIDNADGTVRANRDIDIAGTRGGSGEITAGRNLALRIAGDYLHDAADRLHADGSLRVSASGTVTNTATLDAGEDLVVEGADIVNGSGARLNGSHATTVTATHGIVNAGRIEGRTVQTHSAALDNTGTVIGNDVDVQAGRVLNAGTAAAIAAAQDLKIYAPDTISNVDGATIYSAGNLRIARDGARDAEGMLANQANALINRSATIEADGDIDVAARSVDNLRTRIVTEAGAPESTSETRQAWFAGLSGDDLRFHQSKTVPSWNWSGGKADVSAAMMLALRAPITIEVPKATVSAIDPGTRTLRFATAPIETYIGPYYSCQPDSPCGPLPTRPLTTRAQQHYQAVEDTGNSYRITFWPDWDPDRHIRPDDIRVRMDLGTDSHDYNEVSRTTTTTTSIDRLVNASAPGLLRAAGAIRINADGGAVLNQSSTMAAGGNLIRRATGGAIRDVGTALQRTVTTTDTSHFYWHQKSGGNHDTKVVPYPTVPVASDTVFALPAVASSNAAVQTAARDVTVTTVDRLGNTVTGAGVDGGTTSRAGIAGGEAAEAQVDRIAGRTSYPQTLGASDGGIPDLTLPANGLFRYQAAPAARYLVATDPRFTQYDAFISSDYMLGQLGLDPLKVAKRLGDGFYEQRLVRDQITRLTGRTLLAAGADQTDAYRALMDNGVAFAGAFGLVPGVGLSPEQMQQLTSDMVWLVSQQVTLPDGSTQSVLVPKLYLAKAHAVNLHDTGALVTAKTVSIAASGAVRNSGRIVGDVATQVLGDNIVNQASIGDKGSATTVRAVQDVLNVGGRIAGDDVVVSAGRDVINVSETISGQTVLDNGYRAAASGLGSIGSISAAGTAAVLAGRDLLISGASVDAGSNAMLAAGRDLKIGTVTLDASQDTASRGGKSYGHDAQRTHAGSEVHAGDSIVAVAGRDATVSGSAIDAGNNVALVAGRNATVTAVLDAHAHSEGSLGGKGAAYRESSYDETASASTIRAGNNATLAAGQKALAAALLSQNGIPAQDGVAAGDVPGSRGGDLAVLGSTVTAGGDGQGSGAVRLMAAGDITVGSVSETHAAQHWSMNRRAGLLSTQQTTREGAEHASVAIGSTVSGDRIAGSAGGDLTVSGSDVAATNEVALHADRDLVIGASTSTASRHAAVQSRKSGMFSAGGMAVTFGSQQSSQTQDNDRTWNTGSKVGSLQGDVALSAGRGYTQTGSIVAALQGDVDIAAQRVDINAATDNEQDKREAHFRQSGLTIALSNPVVSAVQTAAQMGRVQAQSGDARTKALAAGTTVLAATKAADAVKASPQTAGGLSISIMAGSASSDSWQTQASTSAVGSRIQAGRDVRIRAQGSGSDSNINVVGSDIVAGNDALLKADNRINLMAAANSAEQHGTSRSSSGGVGVQLNIGSNGFGFGVAANASGARGNADGSDTRWTHSHATAGNTLTLESAGDTTLRGGVASGRQVVADIGGNLVIDSVQDTSSYRSKSQSIGGNIMVGYGFSASGSASRQSVDNTYASVTEQSGLKAGDGGFQVNVAGNTALNGGVIASTDAAVQGERNRFQTAGTLTQSDIDNHADYAARGFSVAVGAAAGAATGAGEDHASSTTRSGISGIAGNVAVRSGDPQTGIVNRFDADKVSRQLSGQLSVGAAFAREASQALEGYVERNRAALREEISAATTDEQRRGAQAKLDELHMEQRALNILIGAVTGNAGKAVTKEALSTAADQMRQLMVEDSRKFAGVVDGDNPPLTNLSGPSVGVRGSHDKLGGTRLDLDKLCGTDNRRCVKVTDEHGNPVLDANGRTQLLLNDKRQVQFDSKAAGMSLEQFLATKEGKALSGATGGIQGRPGTLFGVPYEPGSWQDRLIESFAGTHDMIGGKLPRIYDELGNAARGRPAAKATAQDIWSATGAIAVSAPFAMSELLSPQLWNAISILIKAGK